MSRLYIFKGKRAPGGFRSRCPAFRPIQPTADCQDQISQPNGTRIDLHASWMEKEFLVTSGIHRRRDGEQR